MKTNHGGKRTNSGRKKKEQTTSTGFRINTESLNTCRKNKIKLNAQINEFVKNIANNLN
jgi:hypothetical protein